MKALILAACGLSLTACSIHIDTNPDGGVKSVYFSPGVFGGEQGNGIVKTEARQLAAFKGIETGGPIDVEIRAGATQSVSVQADSNLLPMIQTQVNGETLLISTKGHFSSRTPLHVAITMPMLTHLRQTGSGDVDVRGFDAERLELAMAGPGNLVFDGKAAQFDVTTSGSGDLKINGLESKKVTLRMGGPGDVLVGGHVGQLDATVNGSGDLRFDGIDGAASVNVGGPGGANLTGRVSSLNANVNGSGDLMVSGLDGGSATVMAGGPGNVAIAGKTGALKAIVSGSGDINAASLSMTDVDAQISGPGGISLGTVEATHFNAIMSGSGDLSTHAGHAAALEVTSSGPGEARLAQLISEDATLRSSGSGDIHAHVNGKLRAISSGPGEVIVQGTPTTRDMQGHGARING